MTNPRLAFNVRGQGRAYPWPVTDPSTFPLNQWKSVDPEKLPPGVRPLPSVTQVLSISAKEALKGWAAEQAIRAGYEAGWPDDVDTAIELHKYAFNKKSKERADAGTRAHTFAERTIQGLPAPSHLNDEDAAFADAYNTFVADWSPEPLHVEATVLNPEVGYGGTADLFAVIDGKTVVLDWKSRGKVPDEKQKRKQAKNGCLYNETRAQLAALAHAPYIAAGVDGHIDGVDVVEGWGVVLYPDGTYAHEVLDVAELERWMDCFQGLLRAWRVLKGAPKGVAV